MSKPAWGRVFAGLREAAAVPWSSYVEHAFVHGLATGRLPQASFRRYLMQDYVFLIHFARAWSLAVVKSGSPDEMRLAAATVHALLDEEMDLHVRTCAGWGIDEAALRATPEASANLAYTRYVLDAGVSGDLLDLLVALAPCVFGYGEIGARLQAAPVPDNPYQEWIDTYGGDDYQQACERVGRLLDMVADRRLGPQPQASPRWPALVGTFETACRLEADFWAIGLATGGP
ncbi:MAG: thiaminase II [Burkholderiaceae bacterium]